MYIEVDEKDVLLYNIPGFIFLLKKLNFFVRLSNRWTYRII